MAWRDYFIAATGSFAIGAALYNVKQGNLNPFDKFTASDTLLGLYLVVKTAESIYNIKCPTPDVSST